MFQYYDKRDVVIKQSITQINFHYSWFWIIFRPEAPWFIIHPKASQTIPRAPVHPELPHSS